MSAPRILIVRLSAIGDTIQTMPVACALRERFPKAFLAWAVEERAGGLLSGHEALDELILLPRGWLKWPGGVWRLRRRLHRLRFDVAIDVQGLTKSALLAWMSGARRRVGFGNHWGRELSKWLNNELVESKATHVVDQYLELLRPLGIESPTVRFQVPEHNQDRENAEAIIGRLGFTDGFAIINLGAGWPSKLWLVDRFAAVAHHLGNKWRCRHWSHGAANRSRPSPNKSLGRPVLRPILLRRQSWRTWPHCAAEPSCLSVPTPGRFTWQPP